MIGQQRDRVASRIAPAPDTLQMTLTQSTNGSVEAPADAAATPAFSPLYQQIKTLILQSLQALEWKPGEAIPSEMELATRFKVSQGTVRKAIDELAAQNLLLRRQGRGTFVATHAERQVRYRFLQLHPDEGNQQSEGPAQRQIIFFRRQRSSAKLARALALSPGEAVLQLRRVLFFGGVPTICEDLWLPAAVFKTLSQEQLEDFNGPMYALFENAFGVRMVRAEEKIKAVHAEPDVAALLQVQAHAPLLSVERVAYTYQEQPMELRRGIYRTDTHHYRNELS